MVEGLGLRVAVGDGFGLPGSNGVGTTTTIRMPATLLASDTGSAHACGFDVLRHLREARRRKG